jgi:hypothetical protein
VNHIAYGREIALEYRALAEFRTGAAESRRHR